MNNVWAVIPSYNEAKTVGKIVREVVARGMGACVVDDGSSDDTAAVAAGEGASIIRHEKNMGKGASLRDAFDFVLRRDCSAAIVIDGDGQHDTESIPDFIREIESSGSDIVIGNRMLNTGPMPYIRRKTNRFMSYLISKVCGQDVPDTQCGYRLIKRKVLESVSLKSSNFEIESELIIKAGKKGFKISSVPIRTVYGTRKSRINPVFDTLRFIVMMIKFSFEK